MGPLPLPLDLAPLITGTHLQRLAEAQIMGQRIFMSPHMGSLPVWDGGANGLVEVGGDTMS